METAKTDSPRLPAATKASIWAWSIVEIAKTDSHRLPGGRQLSRPPGCNPFSTRWIRPGELPFRFPEDTSAAELLCRLHESGWWGEILGRHGSGKSALVAALMRPIRRAGRHVHLVTLHDGQRQMPRLPGSLGHWGGGLLLVVDGYEQLGAWSRFRLRRRCRRRGWGLLVTAHTSVGLPTLVHLKPDLTTAQRLVAELMRGFPPQVTTRDVAQEFARHNGNLREMFFALYDLYEQRKRSQP